MPSRSCVKGGNPVPLQLMVLMFREGEQWEWIGEAQGGQTAIERRIVAVDGAGIGADRRSSGAWVVACHLEFANSRSGG